jgi:hypothetical protein
MKNRHERRALNFDEIARPPRRSCGNKNTQRSTPGRTDFLNQRCAMAPNLESILRARMRKIVLHISSARASNLRGASSFDPRQPAGRTGRRRCWRRTEEGRGVMKTRRADS